MPTPQQQRPSQGRKQPSPSRSSSQGATAERDDVYGIISVMYHALQGAETYTQYVRDARRAGDDELVAFFEQCCEEETQRAERAKGLLADRLEEGGAAGEEED